MAFTHTHTHTDTIAIGTEDDLMEEKSNKVISFQNRFSDTPYINDKIFCFGCNKNRWKCEKILCQTSSSHFLLFVLFFYLSLIFYLYFILYFFLCVFIVAFFYAHMSIESNFHITPVVFSPTRHSSRKC